MEAGWMEKYSLASALMLLATLAHACLSASVMLFTVAGWASETRLVSASSGICGPWADTQMTPFMPSINCTPARQQNSCEQA